MAWASGANCKVICSDHLSAAKNNKGIGLGPIDQNTKLSARVEPLHQINEQTHTAFSPINNPIDQALAFIIHKFIVVVAIERDGLRYIIIIIDHHRRCWQRDNLERKRLLSLRTESDASPHIFLLLQATAKIRSDSPSVQISITIHLDSIIVDVLLILISRVSDCDVVGIAVGVERLGIFWSALNSGVVDCGF
ncbi:hypothetical protein AKJ16_DCAP24388 [Drosera capensis]